MFVLADITYSADMRRLVARDGTIISENLVGASVHKDAVKITIRDSFLAATVRQNCLEDLNGKFYEISFADRYYVKRHPNIQYTVSFCRGYTIPKTFYLEYVFSIRSRLWDRPWSPILFMAAMNEIVEEALGKDRFIIALNDYQPGDFSINFKITNSKESIQSIFRRFDSIIADFADQAIEKASSIVRKDTIVTLFDFPAEVQTMCGQYLYHFVDFLRDMGIQASAELKEESGRTLFSVTPKDKDEALDKIRTALEIYLRLPGSKHFNDGPDAEDEDITVARLRANVDFLKGQLRLKTAEIKQLTMLGQRQDGLIDRLLTGQVVVDSATPEQQEPKTGEIVTTSPIDVDKAAQLPAPLVVRLIHHLLNN